MNAALKRHVRCDKKANISRAWRIIVLWRTTLFRFKDDQSERVRIYFSGVFIVDSELVHSHPASKHVPCEKFQNDVGLVGAWSLLRRPMGRWHQIGGP